MKLLGLVAAALVAVAGIGSVGVEPAADAQQRVVVRERTVVQTRRAGYRRPALKRRTVCNYERRGGRRVRICRTIRRR